jgi:hypothetical protein
MKQNFDMAEGKRRSEEVSQVQIRPKHFNYFYRNFFPCSRWMQKKERIGLNNVSE